MEIAGIIAEYHPFHRGHAWQIQCAKALGAQVVVVALSSGMVQRGGVPLLPEEVRVKAALSAGADLVLELPAPYAHSGAEQFAAAGVRILAAAGCDTLVFGTEDADAAQCDALAQALCSPAYESALREALDQGARNFAAARQAALEQLCPDAASLVQRPNNNLGIEYARANRQQQTELRLCPLPRQGVGHHDGASGSFASASHLRALWQQQGVDALAPYVPAEALAAYHQAFANGLDLNPKAVDIAVLSRLRMQCAHGFGRIRGISEGLEFALEKAVRTADTVEGLCDALTTSRYPRARMRRLVWDAALGWGGEVNVPVPYLHILGARRTVLPLLAKSSLPVDVSLAKLEKQGQNCAVIAAAQANAVDLGALCRRSILPMGTAYTRHPVIW